jgi:hypothetical protein
LNNARDAEAVTAALIEKRTRQGIKQTLTAYNEERARAGLAAAEIARLEGRKRDAAAAVAAGNDRERVAYRKQCDAGKDADREELRERARAAIKARNERLNALRERVTSSLQVGAHTLTKQTRTHAHTHTHTHTHTNSHNTQTHRQQVSFHFICHTLHYAAFTSCGRFVCVCCSRRRRWQRSGGRPTLISTAATTHAHTCN